MVGMHPGSVAWSRIAEVSVAVGSGQRGRDRESGSVGVVTVTERMSGAGEAVKGNMRCGREGRRWQGRRYRRAGSEMAEPCHGWLASDGLPIGRERRVGGSGGPSRDACGAETAIVRLPGRDRMCAEWGVVGRHPGLEMEVVTEAETGDSCRHLDPVEAWAALHCHTAVAWPDAKSKAAATERRLVKHLNLA